MITRHLRMTSLVPAAVLVLMGCGEAPPEPEPELRPIRSATIRQSGGERERTFSGTFRATIRSRLSFRVPGTVQQLPVTVGQTVRSGQLIAQLDPRDYELQVQEARAGLTQARAAKRNAEAERDRFRELYENDNASLSAWDQARAAAESSAAQVESLEKRLELAQRQYQYTRLTAPVDGAIASTSAEINENVQAGQTIVTMTSGTLPEVEFALPGKLIAEVEESDDVTVSCDAYPGEALPAVVTEVGVAAIGSTTFPVRVRLDEPRELIRPGMAAEVTLTFEQADREGRIFVPPVAVGEDRQGRYVFKVESNGDGTGVVHRHGVTVGELTTDGLEIVGGLSVGDVVATAGVRRLEEGLTVRLEDGR
jgi:RND family efflux transporter MFP subunit